MDHHGGVHAVERPPLHHEDFPPPPSSAGVPSTRSVIPRSSARGASARPAPIAAEAITLCPQAGPRPAMRRTRHRWRRRWARPGGSDECRRQVADAHLHRQAGVGQLIGAPPRCALLFEAHLRLPMNPVRQVHEPRAVCGDGGSCLLLQRRGRRTPPLMRSPPRRRRRRGHRRA